MSAPLMKSVSGIRGIVGESFTPDLVLKVGSALASFLGPGVVVLGRDSRPSGQFIAQILESVLALSGRRVVNLGLVPTPTVGLMIRELQAKGGVMISASHNPSEWNAFKLFNDLGMFLNASEMEKFYKFLDQPSVWAKWNKIFTPIAGDETESIHLKKILKVVPPRSIKKKKFKVAFDAVNGSGSFFGQRLLEIYGCQVFPLYCEGDGLFARGPEPLPENLKDLGKLVLEKKVDLGFALDPDADRLALVDENGIPLGEESTLALVVDHLLSLSKKKGKVVVNLSTSKMIDDLAKKYGASVIRTRVGEINVSRVMKRSDALIGGEGNGGVIAPALHLSRDSLIGMAYILEMMAFRRKKLSELKSDLPVYFMKKGKITLSEKKVIKSDFLRKIAGIYQKEKISIIDGLRIDFKNEPDFKEGWVHLRKSNTEPIFRIIAEGKTSVQVNKIYQHFKKLLG
jgi:phosphomannomutase